MSDTTEPHTLQNHKRRKQQTVTVAVHEVVNGATLGVSTSFCVLWLLFFLSQHVAIYEPTVHSWVLLAVNWTDWFSVLLNQKSWCKLFRTIRTTVLLFDYAVSSCGYYSMHAWTSLIPRPYPHSVFDATSDQTWRQRWSGNEATFEHGIL